MEKSCEDKGVNFRILLLMDEGKQGFVTRPLSRTNYSASEVIMAAERPQAMKLLAETEVDIMLVDASPGSGREQSWVTIQTVEPNLPIIVVSDTLDRNLCSKAVASGAQDYLALDRISPFFLERSIRFAIDRQKLLVQFRLKIGELADTHDKYRRMVERNPDGVLVVDEEGVVLYANRKALKFMDRTEREAIGKPFGYPLVPEGPDELEFLGKDGESIVVETRVEEIVWQGENAYLLVLREISSWRRLERDLRESIEVERFVTTLATQFMSLPPDKVEHGIRDALRQIGEFCRSDRAFVFLLNRGGAMLENTFEWSENSVGAVKERSTAIPMASLGWLSDRLSIYETVIVTAISDLPQEAVAERELLVLRNVKSMVAVAMKLDNKLLGVVGMDAVSGDRMWSEDEVGILKISAEIMALALERGREHRTMRINDRLLEKLVENPVVGVMFVGARGLVARMNDRLGALFEFDAPVAELVGEPAGKIMATLVTRAGADDKTSARLKKIASSRKQFQDERAELSDGRILSLDVEPLKVEGKYHGSLWRVVDATRELEAEERLEAFVRRDIVTGLSNRQRFLEDMELYFSQASGTGNILSLLLVDLDQFRSVNDTFGLAAGDKVLKQAAARISETVKGSDLVGRFSGDEFAVLLASPEDVTEVEKISRRLLRALAKPFDIGAQAHELSVSIGVGLYPTHGGQVESLIQNADMALVQAKEQGGDCFQVYNAGACQLVEMAIK